MNDDLLVEKLQALEQRYDELTGELADPEVVADHRRYQKTAKAHSELGEIVSKFHEWQGLDRGISDTRAMLGEAEDDAEMKAMAEEELASLERRLEECRQSLRTLLLPKDPNDERNVILEIRAGTGGTKRRCSRLISSACTPATQRQDAGIWRSCRRTPPAWEASRRSSSLSRARASTAA